MALDIARYITEKRKTFDLLAQRFNDCCPKGARPVRIRYVNRNGKDNVIASHLNGRATIVDFEEGNDHWHSFEIWDQAIVPAGWQQLVLQTDHLAMYGEDRDSFDAWLILAQTAGKELDRCLVLAGETHHPSESILWLHTMTNGWAQGRLTLPMYSTYVDEPLWLEACTGESAGENTDELFAAVQRAGRETVCADIVTASALWANWHAQNDWPFGVIATTPYSQTAVVLTELEASTPQLDVKSINWIKARKENEEKLFLSVSSLATYRLASLGGRQLSPYFGVDKDGRRWRRRPDRTEQSTVFYFAPDVNRHQKQVSN